MVQLVIVTTMVAAAVGAYRRREMDALPRKTERGRER
jgi:hypothetical protein